MDKFYKISDAAKIVGVTASTIRYWEKEFEQLKPHKTGGGQRFYSAKTLELLHTLKNMLYVHKFTIEGAKKQLRSKEPLPIEPEQPTDTIDKEHLKAELLEIIQLLKR